MNSTRRDLLRGLAAIAPAAALGLLGPAGAAEAQKRRTQCQGCSRRYPCNRKTTCVQGRCIPKGYPLVCGGAYLACKNGRMPVCNGGVAECSGQKPATPFCG